MPLLGDQNVSPASELVMQELSGEQRQLTLVGRALPYRPIELSGTMRAQVTYYAGNPVGTLQVLGAQEEPTTLTGQWKDRFIQTTDFRGVAVSSPEGAAILDGSAVANVRSLVKLVDDFRRKGQLLELRWDEHIRRGILAKFTVKWHNPHDVEFEMQFTWISQGEEAAAPTFTEVDQQSVSSDVKNAALRALASAQWPAGTPTAWPATVLPASSDVFSTLQNLNADISLATVEAEDTVEKTVSRATSPIDAAYHMLATLQHAVNSAQAVMDFTQEQVDRAVIGKPIATITLGQTLVASLYLRLLRQDSRNMRSTSLRHREEMRDRIGLRSAPAIHIMQQGEDLRTVAIRFYGRADDWRRIALFNGFGGAQVPVGTQILVPPAAPDASRAGVV